MRAGNILRLALRSAARLALLLVAGIVLNGLLLGYAVFRLAGSDTGVDIGDIAAALEQGGEARSLPPELTRQLDRNGCWVMLLDGAGQQLYQYAKPSQIPSSFTLAEVAQFTRWYLMDYPVRVRTMGEGLLVLGSPKNSLWKYSFEAAMPTLLFWPVWAGIALLCNFLLILAVSALSIDRSYKKRDAARAEWIAAVSHDVRTPLAAVLGYSASLEEDPALPPAQREQAGLIRGKGEELRRLIEDLNLTNRLQHSMEPLQEQWLCLAAVVREAVVGFLNGGLGEGFDITADISPAAAQLRLRGDRALILRMLNNLISNSLRHNPGGCTVSVSLSARGGRLILAVGDDGEGYSPQQLKKLSERNAPVTSGHGLGLTIVRQIALAHRGRIRFSNSPSGGALCTLSFRGRR